MTEYNYPVKLQWQNDNGVHYWNQTCAMVLEVFGLPGNRFMYRPYNDHMVFEFRNEKDQKLCEILLSERL